MLLLCKTSNYNVFKDRFQGNFAETYKLIKTRLKTVLF